VVLSPRATSISFRANPETNWGTTVEMKASIIAAVFDLDEPGARGGRFHAHLKASCQ
jgi:hypothetical protein